MLRRLTLALATACCLEAAVARADSLPLTESACNPAAGWICYTTGSQSLTTTHDVPTKEWTITPIGPPDPENWRPINVHVGVGGPGTFLFVYPEPGAIGEAGVLLTFLDSTGRELFRATLPLGPNCFVMSVGQFAGKWVCGDGNIPSGGSAADFGEVAYGGGPLDPMLPSLDGPITVRVGWSVSTSEPPEFSQMTMHNVFVGLIYAPIPEPSAALLTAAGLGLLAGLRRGRPRTAKA